MALQMQNVLLVIGCIVVGGVLGFIWRLEERTNNVANRVQQLIFRRSTDPENNQNHKDNRFAEGLTITSILFCTGAMAVLGSMQSGMAGNHEILFTKAIIDAVTSVPMAAIYGIGVAFSAVSVFLYQGAIAFVSSLFSHQLSPTQLNDLSGVGGVLLLMTGCNLTGILRVAVGDYMPAILLVLLSLFLV